MRRGRAALRALGLAVKRFHAHGALDLAAGVAFYSLLSVAPCLYLVGHLLARLGLAPESARTWIEDGAAFLPPEAAEALRAIPGELHAGQGLVLIALPALAWVATSGARALQTALDVAFGCSSPGWAAWSTRLRAILILALAGAGLLGASLAASVVPRLDQARARVGLPPVAAGVVGQVAPLALVGLSYAMFLLLYRLLPRRRPRWGPACAGAGLALVLWEVGRRLFGRLLAGSHAFGLLTGTLATVVTLVLWVQAAAAIVILGAELAAVLDGRHPVRPASP